MKKTIFTLALLIFSFVAVQAQVKEGIISYSLDFITPETGEETADEAFSMASMMDGSNMKLYFNETNTRVEFKMGTMMDMVSINNIETKSFLMLIDMPMMGMKVGTTASEEELGIDKEAAEASANIEFTKEKKKILGYKCKKAIITDSTGTETIYWYTEEIEVYKQNAQYLNSQIPGMLMEMEVESDEFTLNIVVTSLEKGLSADVAAEKFDMTIPEAYEKMSYEEFTSMGM